ncbi:MAG: tRNA delta(2)-isopentenylpyrophosphate transferase, tRNA dimethylallyltransferase [Candidatus Parcubacteria bacterium]|jgi:tRNA dimethylallyltransferase
MSQKPKIIVIVGPTASGKSNLGVSLAKRFNGEVISADSRQVYKGLDIGTGKITPAEMQGIPHHLIDVASPDSRFSVEKYKNRAEKKVGEILKRGNTPIIVGGTGFYIEALVDNILLPQVKPNLKLRRELSKKTPEELITLLQKADPRRASNIDIKNTRRIIRALEIADSLGKTPVAKKDPLFEALFIGLNIEPVTLRERIAKRLRERIEAGMIKEAQKLHEEGLSWKRMDELGLEYRYLALHLKGKLTQEEMIAKLEFEIWHYAKRQLTWFKRDKRIQWLKPENVEEIENKIKTFLVNEHSQQVLS